MAAPVPKTGELFEKLALLSATDDFQLRSVAADARKMMHVHPGGAHSVLGAVAALRTNRDDSIHHHEISVKLEDSVLLWLNYCTSLTHLDEPTKRLEVATQAIARHPDSQELLNVAIVSALQAAELAVARKLCDAWAERYRSDHEGAVTIGKLLRAVESGQFSADGVRGVLEVAREVRLAASVPGVNAIHIIEQPDYGSILWSSQVPAPPKTAARLNEELADRLAVRDDLLEDPGLQLVVMFEGVS